MIGSFGTLFLAGVTFGAVSVVLFFVRRYFNGHCPRCLLSQRNIKKSEKRGAFSRIASFCFDFFLFFFSGTYLVLYDATVLGGLGRIYHLGIFLAGVVLIRRLLLSVLYRPCETIVQGILEVLSALIRLILYPFRKSFSFLSSILCALYLILKQKNDKIKKKKQAKREIRRLFAESDTAFLTAAVTGGFAPGRD